MDAGAAAEEPENETIFIGNIAPLYIKLRLYRVRINLLRRANVLIAFAD